MADQPLPTTVRGCARCGSDHDSLEYRPFRQPVPDVDGDFTHWAPCPETGDPILLRFVDTDAVEKMLAGRIAVAARHRVDGEWQTLPVAAVAELLRRPHDPRQWDAVWVYLTGEGGYPDYPMPGANPGGA